MPLSTQQLAAIELSTQQLAAIETLEWLLDEQSPRRSGRSVAIAVATIRVASRNPGNWVRIADHAQTREASNYLTGVVHRMLIVDFDQNDFRIEPTRPALQFLRPVEATNWVPSERALGRENFGPSTQQAAREAMLYRPHLLSTFTEQIGRANRSAIGMTQAYSGARDLEALTSALSAMRSMGTAPPPIDPGIPKEPAVEAPSQWERLLAEDDI